MRRNGGDNPMIKTIRETFKASGLSMKGLADASGVPYASVHGAIATGCDPALSTVYRLCKVLDLELRPIKQAKRKAKR